MLYVPFSFSLYTLPHPNKRKHKPIIPIFENQPNSLSSDSNQFYWFPLVVFSPLLLHFVWLFFTQFMLLLVWVGVGTKLLLLLLEWKGSMCSVPKTTTFGTENYSKTKTNRCLNYLKTIVENSGPHEMTWNKRSQLLRWAFRFFIS